VHSPVRYLIISDIHGNLEALTAVLAAAEGQFDAIACCGDLVGYGPDPNAVIDLCRQKCSYLVRGNHDKACAGLADLDWFNSVAQTSALWSAAALTRSNLEWLRSLPQGPLDTGDFAILHGSPADEDEYITDTEEAKAAADYITAGISFFGHSHLQGGFQIHRSGSRHITSREFQAAETSAWLINPGSVGQPRDGDPKAAYALFDSVTHFVQLCRVPYSIERTHQKIVDAGLPEVLALRLYHGL
jgi:predicted phosphodiesterase